MKTFWKKMFISNFFFIVQFSIFSNLLCIFFYITFKKSNYTLFHYVRFVLTPDLFQGHRSEIYIQICQTNLAHVSPHCVKSVQGLFRPLVYFKVVVLSTAKCQILALSRSSSQTESWRKNLLPVLLLLSLMPAHISAGSL